MLIGWMASSEKQLRDDFQACVVCERSYKYTSNLACGHTMCRGCLAKYKISQRDATGAKSTQCPSCQKTGEADPGSSNQPESEVLKKTSDSKSRQKKQVANPKSSVQQENIKMFKKKPQKKSKPTVMDTSRAKSDPDDVLKGAFDPYCKPILVNTIDISTEGDENTPDATDVTVVDVDGIETLVVTDYHNSIKSFYTMEKVARHSSLKVNDEPWSVTRLHHNQVAVSFAYCMEIAIVQVTPDLVLLSKIPTKKMYRGLTALNDSTLVAGCEKGRPSVDILDMTGRVLKSITPGNKSLRHPDFLTTTRDGNILVSDCGADAVLCLTPNGDVVFKYRPPGARSLGYAQGITTSPAGEVLVMDWKISRLVQITPTGQFDRDLLKPSHGIDNSHGVCLHRDKLYVTVGSDVKVFNVGKQTSQQEK